MNYKAITHLPYKIFKARGSGLKRSPKDDNDFQTGIFGWFEYKPKYIEHIIKTLSVRNQKSLNTCQWNATTVQKEPDEKGRLSVKSLVIKGKMLGYISGNGYSNLRDGQKVLQKWGILSEGLIDETVTSDWEKYSDPKAIQYLDKEAAKHKISSYWSVSSRNDALKLLDDDRIIATGLKWYTGWNVGGGFSFPWLISWIIGLLVGGHAIVIIGYNLNYRGTKVYICQNSYGGGWGDHGKFYVSMDYMDKKNYGYWTNLDEIDKELGKFMMDYDGKNVKGKGDSSIFHIQKGTKKPYLNWESFLAWNGKVRGFVEVDKNTLDKIPKGEIMDITKTDYWQFLKDVKEADRLPALLELLNKEN